MSSRRLGGQVPWTTRNGSDGQWGRMSCKQRFWRPSPATSVYAFCCRMGRRCCRSCPPCGRCWCQMGRRSGMTCFLKAIPCKVVWLCFGAEWAAGVAGDASDRSSQFCGCRMGRRSLQLGKRFCRPSPASPVAALCAGWAGGLPGNALRIPSPATLVAACGVERAAGGAGDAGGDHLLQVMWPLLGAA